MNKPESLAEWNGKDPGDVFTSEIDAANDVAIYYDGTSIFTNTEFASVMFIWVADISKGCEFIWEYSYTLANTGSFEMVPQNFDLPEDTDPQSE